MVSATIKAALEACLGGLRLEPPAVYLFGSMARGTERQQSDVDLAVLFDPAPEPALDAAPFRLEDELERALGRTVQLISLNTAPPDLAIRVLREGELLFEGDRSKRIRFEVRTRNEFFDLERTLKRYRRQELAR